MTAWLTNILSQHVCSPLPCVIMAPPSAVLANEEVIDGVSERGGHPVVRMPMKQWMLKITAYGDRQGSLPSLFCIRCGC